MSSWALLTVAPSVNIVPAAITLRLGFPVLQNGSRARSLVSSSPSPLCPSSSGSSGGHECSFKFLLIGDSGVGKSSVVVSFVAASHLDGDIAPTIGTPSIATHATARHGSAALRSLARCSSPYHSSLLPAVPAVPTAPGSPLAPGAPHCSRQSQCNLRQSPRRTSQSKQPANYPRRCLQARSLAATQGWPSIRRRWSMLL